MTPAEIAVLYTLRPGAAQTVREIQQSATLTTWRARNAVAHLAARGLITATAPGNRWRITPRGRSALATKAKRFG